MNLHAIVSGAISAVNPLSTATLRVSTGYGFTDDGRQVPTYAPDVQVTADIQSLSARDVRQIEFLNLQNIQNTIYLNGQVSGIVRSQNKGGDLILTDDGAVYLVVAVLEQWPDWVKVAVTLQDQSGNIADITPPTIGQGPIDGIPDIGSPPFNWAPPTILAPTLP